MEGTISIREYARQRGCSDTAVHKAIRSGKIVEGVRRDANARPWIVPDVADSEWKVSREMSISKSPTIDKKVGAKELQPSTAPVPPAFNPDGGGMVQKMTTARLVKMTNEAKIKELEYKKKAGVLVERDKVYAQLFAAGQQVRTAFQIIPDRFIDQIFGAKDRNEAHSILTHAIAEALESLAGVEKTEIKAA